MQLDYDLGCVLGCLGVGEGSVLLMQQSAHACQAWDSHLNDIVLEGSDDHGWLNEDHGVVDCVT